MNIKHNISLKHYNTFGIDVNATHFITVTSVNELITVLNHTDYSDIVVLGGGSNILFTQHVNALVIHVNSKGKRIVYEDDTIVHIEVAAGENWHEFVLWTLEHQFGGIENLSLIPGNTGAAPIQNIGAYGVELKDVFIACQAVDKTTRDIRKFTHSECKFGYRNSIFKNEAKGKYIITSVTLRLQKKEHRLHLSYGSIQDMLEAKEIHPPTIKDVSDAVIRIRKSKLPDPAILGNGGSFFKNPVIPVAHFNRIKKTHPNIPSYPVPESPEQQLKIPAGWLIEQCGFKGKRMGDAGVHEKQALVLVNYGNATGASIRELAKTIQATVKQRFDIALETEVNIL
ncbi:MAG: UDP-N-acetylmuramate dehydrogenase [Bacteroidota bacterium]